MSIGGRSGITRSSVVTLLFTDLVGSSSLLDRLGEDGAEETRRMHFRLLREAVADAGGHEVKNLGDGLMVAFASALDAVRSAVAMQRAIAGYNRTASTRLEVRVGLHVGEPIIEEDDYFGKPVVVAKRLCDAAAGCQILASDLVRGLVAGRGDIEFTPHGAIELKGLAEAVTTFTVGWEKPSPPQHADTFLAAVVPLVGREQEATRLDTELATAAGGGLRVLLITGEPGVGKTRLTRELEGRHEEDALTLVARAHPFGAAASLGVWVEALERHLAPLDPIEVSELAGVFAEDLSSLLPSIASATGGRPISEPPRLRLLAGLGGVIGSIASQRPLVVVLDDMHLADSSSWEAVTYIAGHLRSQPILLVLVARPGELADNALSADVLEGLEQDGVLSRLTLDALGREDVADLAQRVTAQPTVPASLVDWLLDKAKGSPLYTLGLLRALVEEGADLARPELHALPEDLTERVAARLRGVDAASLSVLEIVAVMAHRVDLRDLLAITGRSIDALAAILDTLVRTRLVVEEERGRELTYEILHPLVQEAIYHNIGGARRRVLHRLVARSLVAAGRPGSAAPHFVRAADPGDQEAIDALTDALGQAEARELHHESLAVMEALLDLLPAHDRRWIDVFDAMAWQAEWVVEHRADFATSSGIKAMRVLDNLIDPGRDPARAGVVKFHLSSFLTWGAGDVAAGRHVAEEARRLLQQAGDAPAALIVTNELGYIAGIEGHSDGHEATARAVVAEAVARGDRGLEMQAQISLLFALMWAGRMADALEALDRAAQIAAQDAKRYRDVYLRAVKGFLAAHLEGRNQAWTHLQSAMADAEMYPQTLTLEFALMTASRVGDYRRGADLVREMATSFGSRPGMRRWLGYGAGVACLAELGRLPEAERIARNGLSVLEGRDWWVTSDVFRWGAGMVAAFAGRADDAAALLTRSVERTTAAGSWGHALYMTADLAEIACDTGDTSLAQQAADALDRAPADEPWQRALAGFGRACVETALSQTSTDDDLRAACDQLDALGWRSYASRGRVLLARRLAGSDRDTARSVLDAAIEGFKACGATVRLERALAVQARLDPRRRGSAPAGPGGLTRREAEVAALAVDGLSAADIGKKLFIGKRTVETHLANVYAKLGVSSRVELVRKAGELGLDGAGHNP